jgi:Ca2+-transporting ATPase
VAGPDEPRVDGPSAAMTMTFVVMGLGTVGNALTNRRDPASGLTAPILKAAAIGLIPVVLLVVATRVDFLQHSLHTQPLTGPQWLACLGLALALPVVVEVLKAVRRARVPRVAAIDPQRAVTPARSRTDAAAPTDRDGDLKRQEERRG